MYNITFNPKYNQTTNFSKKHCIKNNFTNASDYSSIPQLNWADKLIFNGYRNINIQTIKTPDYKNSMLTVSKLLKPVMDKMNENDAFNPQIIDNILTDYVGRENVRNIPFHLSDDKSAGRSKSYKFEDGSIFNLDGHISKRGPVIRLYKSFDGKFPIQNKNDRYYMDKNSKFAKNTYTKTYTHLKSDSSCKTWIDEGEAEKNSKYQKQDTITILNLPSGIPKKPIEIVGRLLKQSLDSDKNSYDPAKLDEMLTKAAGNSKDIKILNNNENIITGRARKYIINKTGFVLESYINKKFEPITRVYVLMQDNRVLKPSQRVFATADGNFTSLSSPSDKINLNSIPSSIDWINSKFIQ